MASRARLGPKGDTVTATAPFRTTREAANALAEEAKQTTVELVRLPFNRFDEVDETTWWLSPRADNPAYKYGKIVCTHRNFEPDMFIGLYVEKGLDPSTITAGLSAKERRYRMDSTYFSHYRSTGPRFNSVILHR